MLVRCERTMTLGRRQSLTYEAMRKMFVPYRMGRASSYLSFIHSVSPVFIAVLFPCTRPGKLTQSDMCVAIPLPLT